MGKCVEQQFGREAKLCRTPSSVCGGSLLFSPG